MKFEYSKTGTSIKPFVLTPELLTAMGRIVRAFTEIEDIVGLYLCQVSGITERQSLVLLGRLGMSAKLQLAAKFASADSPEAAATHDLCFDNNEGFQGLKICRNAIAHGLLLGLTDEGKIAFRTVDVVGVDQATATLTVVSFAPDAFDVFAQSAENSIPKLEKLLKLGSSREKRRLRALDRHRKSQPDRPPSARPMRERKPSRKKPPKLDN